MPPPPPRLGRVVHPCDSTRARSPSAVARATASVRVFITAISLTWWYRDATYATQLLVFAVMIVPIAGLWLWVSLRLPHGTASWKALLPGALLVAVGFQVVHGMVVWLLGPKLEHATSLSTAASASSRRCSSSCGASLLHVCRRADRRDRTDPEQLPARGAPRTRRRLRARVGHGHARRLVGPLRHASSCRRSEKNSSAVFVLVSCSPVRSMPCWVRNALVTASISNASEGAQLGGMPAGEAAYQQGHVTRPASEGHGAASRRIASIASAAAIRGASIYAISDRTMLQPA